MAPATPFAYGPLGDALITTDNDLVRVSPTGKQGPRWSYRASAPVAGVLPVCVIQKKSGHCCPPFVVLRRRRRLSSAVQDHGEGHNKRGPSRRVMWPGTHGLQGMIGRPLGWKE